jgi:pyridinium-3,5-biscarboxylic acid mononucleotide synthase
MKPLEMLEKLQNGVAGEESIREFYETHGFVQLGEHRLDVGRESRSAVPEVIFGLGKSVDQLREIVGFYVARQLPLLVTKLDVAKGTALAAEFPPFEFNPSNGLGRIGRIAKTMAGSAAVLTAGSSDAPIAEEALGSLDFFGISTLRAFDCGVAGIHRLFASAHEIREADVLIVVAGMEGALPSVVAALFRQPVIAVPTSVGYGASFEGLAALLGMMNSCAPGVLVVNIDNGFGAAAAARKILAGRKAG